jgi:hypothetical protein
MRAGTMIVPDGTGPARSRPAVRALVVGALAFALALGALLARAELVVLAAIATSTGDRGEVFYAGDEGYAPDRSVVFAMAQEDVARPYRIVVPRIRGVTRLRLDIGDRPGTFAVEHLEVRPRIGGFDGPRHVLSASAASLHDASAVAAEGGALRAQATGQDPYLDLQLPTAAVEAMRMWRRIAAVAGALLVAVLAAGAVFIGSAANRRFDVRDRLLRLQPPAALRALARRASDGAAIRFEPLALSAVLLAVALALVGVGAKLNFSSVAMWDVFVPAAGTAHPPVLGQPRAIRSDEWRVQTPWILSQVARDLPVANPAVGGEAATLLASVPVRHPVIALQPEFWGFVLFDAERAVSWFWMYKAFGLFVSSFLLMMLLTRSDGTVSLLSAVWICLSSYTQWWFSSNLAELLTGFFLALAGLGYLCLSRRTWAIGAGWVLLLLGSATFIFQLYPAYQVPLGYLALAIAGGAALDAPRRALFAERWRLRVGLLAAAAAVLGAVLARFWVDARATVEAMGATAYPGARVSVGGDLTWRRVFDGLFEPWRLDERIHPYTHLNASEASNFVLLFPFVVLAMAWSWRKRRADPTLLVLATFCCVLAAWMIAELPMGAALALSNATMLSFVSATRALPALGVASILCCAIWMATRRRESDAAAGGRVPTWAWALVLLAFYHQGALTMADDPAFFRGWRIMLGCALAALAAVAIGRAHIRAYALLVAVVALPALAVNPVNRGLQALLDKPVLAAAADAGGGSARWLVIGSAIVPQAFKARGLEVFGGTLMLPDYEAMRVLDPGGASSHVWNRYAHVQVDSAPGLPAPRFTLDHLDAYRIELDVCSPRVDALSVDRVAYTTPVPPADLRCLSPLRAPVDGIALYARARLEPRSRVGAPPAKGEDR